MSERATRLLERLVVLWRRRLWLSGMLYGLALALPFVVLSRLGGEPSGSTIMLLAAAVAALIPPVIMLLRGWTIDTRVIARHLDRAHPEMQDSCGLLLTAPARLSLLQQLQRGRVASALCALDRQGLLPRRPLSVAGRWLAGSIVLSGIGLFGVLHAGFGAGSDVSPQPGGETSDEIAIRAAGPTAELVAVEIRPPRYTGQPPRSVEGLSLAALDGSTLHWTVRVRGEIDGAVLVFEDQERLQLELESGVFTASRTLAGSHLYYLSMERNGREVARSDYGHLEMLPDRPPELRVLQPDRVVELKPESAGPLVLEVEARDDYGLIEATVVATLVRGSGESVKFRERRLDLGPVGASAAAGQLLTRRLDPVGLGLEPGTELYFYVEALDNRRPEPNRARTAARFVRMPGEAATSAPFAAGLPVIGLPEFFRSQRQIILDTEKLISERGRITVTEFERRSQGLGFDQRALRMRYGILLGEEFESGLPVDEPGAEEHDDEASAVPEEWEHQHDSEESATFFPTEIRRQLKAALREMWEAEGELRTFAPGAALPHEYGALRLLKDAQQRSRVYVQRIGFDPPPLYPDEKRLTGDLADVRNQFERERTDRADDAQQLRRALDALRNLETALSLPPADLGRLLEAAERSLVRAALERSAADLEVLDSLQALVRQSRDGESLHPADVQKVVRGLWAILPEPESRPSPGEARYGKLFESYRRRLEAE